MHEKKRKLKALFSLPFAAFAFLTGAGYVAQFFENYAFWSNSGAVLGDGTTPVIPAFHILTCWTAVFRLPYGLYGVAVCGVLLSVLILLVMKLGHGNRGEKDDERNFRYSDQGTYGTSGFMTYEEMDRILEHGRIQDVRGIILGEFEGEVVALPEDTMLNRNMAVYGSSGSMKSRAFCRNAILQAIRRNESLICVDVKSELYESTAAYAESQGYTVRVLNLVNQENSDGWNCLAEIAGDDELAQVLVDVAIENTGSKRGDPFWDNGELNLLKALVLLVDRSPEGVSKTIIDAYRMLTLNSEPALNAMFDALPITHPAKAPYNIFRQASDSVRSGIIIGLGTRLQVLQNKKLQNVLSHNEIDLTLPGKQKCAYYIVISDQDKAFEFISSLFFSFLIIKLVRYADKYCEGRVLPVPVNIIADEFNSCGKISLATKISTIRSRGIGLAMAFQNLPQLQNRYPFNEWQEILGNCDTTLFMGCTDEVTAKAISERTGVASVSVNSESKMLGTWRISNYTPEYRKTDSIGRRNLLNMDEVMRLPSDEALVFLRGQKVLRVKKVDYTRHKDASKLTVQRVTEHVPAWRKLYKDSDIRSPAVDPFVYQKPAKPRRRKKDASVHPDYEQLKIEPVDREELFQK